MVDSVGFNDRFWFDFKGHPHTEKLHTIERYTRTNMSTLVDPDNDRRPRRLYQAVHGDLHGASPSRARS